MTYTLEINIVFEIKIMNNLNLNFFLCDSVQMEKH